MLLNGKEIHVLLFEVTNSTFEQVGEVNAISSLLWREAFNGYESFEITAPVTKDNAELFKKERVVWCGGDSAAVIEIISTEIDEAGNKLYKVKGRTLESLLTRRIVWDTFSVNSAIYASTAIYRLVDTNAINPKDAKRKIPFLELAQDNNLGNKISFQKTGGEVYEAVFNICDESQLGFFIKFDPYNARLIFEVKQGIDRTVLATDDFGADYVEFSSELDDILTSSLYINSQENKNIALVAGEDSGDSRKKQVTGEENAFGLLRKEVYVDARDLQSQYENESGETVNLTPEQYNEMLKQRGNEVLSDAKELESFEAVVKTSKSQQYQYGKDYNIGDLVIVSDKQLGVTASAKVTAVEEGYSESEGYSMVLTLGYTILDISRKRKLI